VSQAFRGNLSFVARGLKSGPAHSGISVAGLAGGVFLAGVLVITEKA
jgi:tetrahydromethanopterin S-methyltransferase subunit F